MGVLAGWYAAQPLSYLFAISWLAFLWPLGISFMQFVPQLHRLVIRLKLVTDALLLVLQYSAASAAAAVLNDEGDLPRGCGILTFWEQNSYNP